MSRHTIPHLKSLMTPFPYTIESDDLVSEAINLMKQHSIHHLPVIVDGRPSGMISARDIASATKLHEQSSKEIIKTAKLKVKDLFSTDVYLANLEEPIDNVLYQMATNRYDATIVIKDGRLAGIFTVGDACMAFAKHLRDHYLPPSGNDAA